ncbi:MAG: redox-regulated ATPase YchF [Candidatus Nanoarchaeia archaeon]|nr:redox-regulated ATPase YchF [Candidatus Nanoarchaeia archaeon]
MLLGVVGKPNVGKSTFFKALTMSDILIANYPFATIEPNKGFGHVRIDCVDTFFNVQCNPRTGFCKKHQRFVPVEIIDVAGLVPGAYEGKGMGNKFLDDLRQADALIHVVDASGSTNEKGENVPRNSYDPVNDVKFLEIELDQWYLGILNKVWPKFTKQIQQLKQDPIEEITRQFTGLGLTESKVVEALELSKLKEENIAKWTDQELERFASSLRKISKPIIIAANKIDIPQTIENVERLKKEFPNYLIIPVSAESELVLREASNHNLIDYLPGDNNFEITQEGRGKLNERQIKALEFVKNNILEKCNSTGIQQVINHCVFDLLDYIAIFPGGMNKLEDKNGRILPDCFLLPNGSKAIDFAYKIHTDLGKHFIKAMDVKEKRVIGADHKLKHLDVIEIMSNA